jgi:hypothetical protein
MDTSTTLQLIETIENETKKNSIDWRPLDTGITFQATYSDYFISISKGKDNDRYHFSISDKKNECLIRIDDAGSTPEDILSGMNDAVLARIYRGASAKTLDLEHAMKSFLSEIYFDKNR